MFYKTCSFGFHAENTGDIVLRFLRTRPEHSLAHIRNIVFTADEVLKGWTEASEEWTETCSILATKCNLRYLELRIFLRRRTKPSHRRG